MTPPSPPLALLRRLCRVAAAFAVIWGLPVLLGSTAVDPSASAFSLDFWHEAQGLPQSKVRAVTQTRDGYLWFGTDGGLIRFDGVSFTSFNVRTGSLPDNEVWTLKEDRAGALWVGTVGGLTRFQAGQFTTFTKADGLPNDWIRQIDEDRDGALWIATSHGICRLVGGVFSTFTTKQGLTQDFVSDVCAGTAEGVYAIAAYQLHRFVDGRFVVEGGVGDKDDGWLTNLSKGADGALWLAFERGIIKRRQAGKMTSYRSENDPAARGGRVFEDAQGDVWVIRRTGLSRLQDGRFVRALSTELNAQLGAVLSVGSDREGSLWLGLEADGVARLRRTQFATLTTDHGLPDNSTRSVFQDSRGDIWIGTINGFARWSGGRMTSFRELDGARIGSVTAIGEDREGVVWFGVAGELLKFHAGRLTKDPTWKRVIEIKTIYRDPQGRMWVGADGGGLFRFEDGRMTNFRVEDGLASNQVRGLLVDRTGALWITTFGAGVSRYADGKFTTFTTKDGLGSDRVVGVYADDGGTLWFATRAGLTRYRDGKFFNFRARDGLFSEFVSCLLDDGRGYFWFSCSQGIFRVRQADLAAFADHARAPIPCEAYSVKDGLRSTAFGAGIQPNACRTAEGKLLFSSLKGLVMMDPARLLPNPLVPPVYVEWVQVGRRLVPVDRPAVIPPGASEVEIHFTGLGFVAPNRVRFKYQLEGFDPDWVDAGTRRFAYYANLPAGKYRFHVIACNEDGLWNETGAAFTFTLTPYFYQRAWFYALVGLAVIGLIGAIHHLRLARLKASERELQRRVDEALAKVKVLGGLIPICASCKNVRDDKGYWNQIEQYLCEHSDSQVSHGICPACIKKLYPDVADEVLSELRSQGGNLPRDPAQR